VSLDMSQAPRLPIEVTGGVPGKMRGLIPGEVPPEASEKETRTQAKPHLFDMTSEELRETMVALGERPWRANQIMAWAYKKMASSFHDMTDLPLGLRKYLSDSIDFSRLSLLKTQEEDKGRAKKYLWGQGDAPLVESVLLRYKYGVAGCISTQAGCPVGCTFCASRVKGFDRNLKRGEMIEEFVGMARDQQERIGHLVFMGTGEPFLNYDMLLGVIDLLSRKETYEMSRRKMTVSTVGIPEKIISFAKDGGGVRLALSLHASKDEVRNGLIPLNRVYPISQTIDALKEYARITKDRVTIEYMLLQRVNDSKDDAFRLARLIRGLDCLVNLIPWNRVPGLPFEPPTRDTIEEFRNVLQRNRIKVTIRRKLGGNIEAACGQLMRKMLER